MADKAEQVARMTFAEFSSSNRDRCESPAGFNHQLHSWSTSDWFTAILGELGEAANVAKKLNRVRDGIRGNKETTDALRNKLRQELGDVFVYLDLLAQSLGFDIGDAAVEVFNAKSKEIGYAALLRPHLEPAAQSSGTVPNRSTANAEVDRRQRSEYSPSSSEAPAAQHRCVKLEDGGAMGSHTMVPVEAPAAQPKGEPRLRGYVGGLSPNWNVEPESEDAPRETRIELIATALARVIYNVVNEPSQELAIKNLLIEFAKEVRRLALEPSGPRPKVKITGEGGVATTQYTDCRR